MSSETKASLRLDNAYEIDVLHEFRIFLTFFFRERPVIRFGGKFVDPGLGLHVETSVDNPTSHLRRETIGQRSQHAIGNAERSHANDCSAVPTTRQYAWNGQKHDLSHSLLTLSNLLEFSREKAAFFVHWMVGQQR
jgi:hypothetical protein